MDNLLFKKKSDEIHVFPNKKYVTSTLMRQFIFSLLSLCRQDLFEVFFPGTVSNTLYPFQELVCFMIVYSFQNLSLF